MRPVLYACPLVPPEWIAAHGLRPSRFSGAPAAPGPAFAGTNEGVCPYIRALADTAAGEDWGAVVLTTRCDQARRAAECIASAGGPPVFLLQAPTTCTAAARRSYGEELLRLGRYLETLGGRAPSPEGLAEALRAWDAARAALRDAAGTLPPSILVERISTFQRDGIGSALPPGGGWRPRGVPLALVGGPLLPGARELYRQVEEAGGYIALDASGEGPRAWPAPFPRRDLDAAPFETLADAYFAIPDAFRRPNTALYRWLRDGLRETGVRGILFHHHVWCDLWRGEAQRMKEWAGLPFLLLEAGADGAGGVHASTRIQAFLEVLQ